jgi:hypothetical protein
VSRIAPDTLDLLRHPDTAPEGVLPVGAWLLLALLGRSTQLRLFPKALHSRAGERYPARRTISRKPRWLVEVSTGWAILAAGR